MWAEEEWVAREAEATNQKQEKGKLQDNEGESDNSMEIEQAFFVVDNEQVLVLPAEHLVWQTRR